MLFCLFRLLIAAWLACIATIMCVCTSYHAHMIDGAEPLEVLLPCIAERLECVSTDCAVFQSRWAVRAPCALVAETIGNGTKNEHVYSHEFRVYLYSTAVLLTLLCS